MFFSRLFLISLLSLVPLSAAEVAKNIVVNGDFQAAAAPSEVAGWTIGGDARTVSVVEEDGNRFLRIKQPALAYCSVVQSFPVAKNWNGLEVKARLRAQNLVKGPEGHNTMTLLFTFEDADGKNVGGWPQHMVAADQGWTEIQETVKEIPFDAATLRVACAMTNAAGTADFDDISVTPLLGADRTPAPKAVEKREGKLGFHGNLVENGDFKATANAGSIPSWQIVGDAGHVTTPEEGGNYFVRLDLPTQGFLVVCQKFDVAGDWKGLNVSARIRLADLKKGPEPYNTATLLYTFDNAKGEHVGPWFQTMIPADQDWTEIKDHVPEIPAGASTLNVSCALMNAAGRADFSQINVTPEIVGDLPPGVTLAGGEPVEEQGFAHGRICLNGVWRFQPAKGASAREPLKDSWGLIRVPGSWVPLERPNFPGVVDVGTGEPWAKWDGQFVSQAWYERPIVIPKDWDGRAILVDLRRVSTDATVYIDDKEIGKIGWPSGLVDVTSAVKAGGSYTLRVLVTAANDREKTLNAMGVGQNTMVDAKLATRGIIGEAFLVSRPPGARIDSAWVRTSVRQHQITVETDFTDVPAAGPVDFHAVVKDKAGKKVKEFDGKADVAAGTSTVSLTWPWADPELWDVGQPNLYTLEIQAKGKGIDAGFTQTFGFREVWVDGRTVYLNGTVFRIRPTSSLPEGEYAANNGNVAVLTSSMKNIMEAGFNCVELWPSDFTVRGTYQFRELISEVADQVGMPLMGPTRHAAEMFGSWEGMKWQDPKARSEWERLLREEWKIYRNNPSIIIWSSSGNIGGHVDDQDPRRIGRGLDQPIWQAEAKKTAGWWNFMTHLQEMVDSVKKMDPTRPYMIHQGGAVGDIYSLNNYLCLTPLQEREEWLSDWTEAGTKPYCAVEFGTPLSTTMNRGRDGFVMACTTEWLMTEFAAVYLGRESYHLEEPAYRNAISGPKYKGGQLWDWPDQPLMDFAPALQQLEKTFITNTWRSWRTMGITGGMIPWGDGQGFKPLHKQGPMAAFVPGQRGTWFPSMDQQAFSPFSSPGVEVTPAGQALIANNGPTLAWIAGPKVEKDVASFTMKDHSFPVGSTIAKQIALLNDTRNEQDWTISVAASLDGQTLDTIKKSGRIAVGQTLFVPVEFKLPKDGNKRSGEISLEAKIGTNQHTDKFAFHAFPPIKPLTGTVSVVDPAGDTTKLLQRLGLKVVPWDGQAAELLVIGRKALSDGVKLPGNLEDFTRKGGRLVIMTQDPTWFKESLGFRISALLSRRVFPVAEAHPVLEGLDQADLRDWNGFSTLVEGKPDYTQPGLPRNIMPTWGWRWGTRGAVSSAAIEKPHRSGWRPLLEGEFDLAYSPLMEMDFGRGRVVLCTLDLEDHAALDPGAELLARNLFHWAMTAPLSKGTAPALYVGGDEGAKLLDLIGADYRRASAVEPTAPLVILGPDVSADAAAPVLAAGGKVLVLPRRQEGPAGLGVNIVKKGKFGGSISVPDWTEARGLSPSDLRWRCDGPALLLDGGKTGADGLLDRLETGKGVAIFCQSDPMTLPADEKQYFRFTRWRETRTLAQLLANLGGSFKLDNRIFNAGTKRLQLDGNWKVAWTNKLPSSAAAFPDPGMSEAASALVKTDADESKMEDIALPTFWSAMASADGEAVFRRHFNVPAELVGQPLMASLGIVDDFDETFVNGVKIGATGQETKSYWSTPRNYAIPANLLKEGDNVIAVRVFDNFGGGGFGGAANGMDIAPASAKVESFYHPDYRADFILGDDPYRYYRW